MNRCVRKIRRKLADVRRITYASRSMQQQQQQQQQQQVDEATLRRIVAALIAGGAQQADGSMRDGGGIEGVRIQVVVDGTLYMLLCDTEEWLQATTPRDMRVLDPNGPYPGEDVCARETWSLLMKLSKDYRHELLGVDFDESDEDGETPYAPGHLGGY